MRLLKKKLRFEGKKPVPKCLKQNFQSGRMSGQLEQPQNSDYAKELEYVGVLDVGEEALQHEVGVEAEGSHVVNNIH